MLHCFGRHRPRVVRFGALVADAENEAILRETVLRLLLYPRGAKSEEKLRPLLCPRGANSEEKLRPVLCLGS